jgi:hypothetical protein
VGVISENERLIPVGELGLAVVVDKLGHDRRRLHLSPNLADLPGLARHIGRDALSDVRDVGVHGEVADLLMSVGMLSNEPELHRPPVYEAEP